MAGCPVERTCTQSGMMGKIRCKVMSLRWPKKQRQGFPGFCWLQSLPPRKTLVSPAKHTHYKGQGDKEPPVRESLPALINQA